MSLFDQMKVQAQQALELNENTETLSAEAFVLRNAKLKEIFNYWCEFSKLIKVIQPEYSHPILLPGIGDMTGLKVVEPFSDYRHTVIGNQNFSDEISNVSLFFFYKSSKAFEFKKEIGVSTRVKDVLWRYGIVHTSDDIKNEQARVIEVGFNIPWQVRGSVDVTSLPNSNILSFELKNIARLGEVALKMPFDQVGTVFLDELSKLLLGRENNFWKLAKF
jgi:hypothetical protein